VIILGIDPGSRVTGFGLVQTSGDSYRYVDSGIIRISLIDNFPQRLGALFKAMDSLLEEYQPDAIAIEKVFVSRSAVSALKLGQARGAAIAACVARGAPVFEYASTEVKKAIVGRGHARKEQVQYMVKVLLSLKDEPQSDAADALAMAMTHGHLGTLNTTIRQNRNPELV